MKSFLRIRYPGTVPSNAPVLMRMMFQQPADSTDLDALKKKLLKYPAYVYYYGPLTKAQVPWIRKQFKKAARGQWTIFAYQIIPIAPELGSHHWPHHDFQAWSAYERQKPRYYTLAQLKPDQYQWQRLASR